MEEYQRTVNAVDGFRLTTAIKKLRKLTKRTRVIPGGSSAGKTFGIIPILIDYAIKHPNTEISIVGESLPFLRRGANKDFLKIMRLTGRYNDDRYNKTQLVYTFANGSYIEFFSADQEDKIRGPRRNILYINECNNIAFETYHQLAIRTSHTIWLDFNPSDEFWAFTECKEDEDTEWLTLTYGDNEALAPSIIKELEKAREKGYIDPSGNLFDEGNIKSTYWANWWKVYGLGLLGSLEGIIFGNWTIVPTIPEGAKLVGAGLDFGYTNDPTAIVDVYTFGNKRVLDLRCYETGLLNDAIAEKLTTRPEPPITYADSAEPKSIAEIKKKHNVHAVFKGKDSINYGVQIMQQQEYLVTESSLELIKEFRSYCWDEDKHGTKLNKPAGGLDHALDAVRYHEMMAIGKKKRTAVFGWGKKEEKEAEVETIEEVQEVEQDMFDVSDLV